MEDGAAFIATVPYWACRAESLCMGVVKRHADGDQAGAVRRDAVAMYCQRGRELPIACRAQDLAWWAVKRAFAEVFTKIFVVTKTFATWDAIGSLLRLR
jgi:hypothetical protein